MNTHPSLLLSLSAVALLTLQPPATHPEQPADRNNPATKKTATPQTVPNGIITTVAGDGLQGNDGNGGPATKAQFIYPSAVAVDSEGNIYIADPLSNEIRKVSASTGIISTYAGTGTAGYSGDKGPAAKAELDGPYSLAFDSKDNLYIADFANNVIRMVNSKTGIITTVAGNGYRASLPYADGCVAPVVSGALATKTPLCYPLSVALDSKDNLYIGEYFQVFKVTASTGIITLFAGSESTDDPGDGGPAVDASIQDPTSLAVDSNDNLFIADRYHCAVRKVDAPTGIITTLAGHNVSEGLWDCSLSGDGGPAAVAELSFPYGVAVDKNDNVFIADTQNGLIREVSATSGDIYTIAGSYVTVSPGNFEALFGYSGDTGPATAATLDSPSSIAPDNSGNLYIADTYDAVIRKVTNAAVLPNEAPVIAFAAGATSGSTDVTITSPLEGTTIYYTDDGSLPTTSSPKYTAPFTFKGSAIVAAFATVPGKENTGAALQYSIYTPSPKISQPSGTISTTTKITVTDANPDLPIYYTTDGSDPIYFGVAYGSTAKQYTHPITLSIGQSLSVAAYGQISDKFGNSYTQWSATVSRSFLVDAAPQATTRSATDVASTSALLNGTIIANNATTQYQFAYGTTSAALTTKTPKTGALNGTGATAVSAKIIGLKPKTTYYYQLVSSNSVGTTSGAIKSFTTD
jgi:hypothetical protein